MLLVTESPRILRAPDANTDGRPLNAVIRESKAQRHLDGPRRYRIAAGHTLSVGSFTENAVTVPIGTVSVIVTTDVNGASERRGAVYFDDLAGSPATVAIHYFRAAANEAAEFYVRNLRTAVADAANRKVSRVRIENDGAVDFEVDITLGHPSAPT